jgi:hypothetical protein
MRLLLPESWAAVLTQPLCKADVERANHKSLVRILFGEMARRTG